MPEAPEPGIQTFAWSRLSELSALLNRLGRHGFREWPESADELQAELELLRTDPELDVGLLATEGKLCGYAIVLPEPDIDRAVASLAAEAKCLDCADGLIRFVETRAKSLDLGTVHVAIRGADCEPQQQLESAGYSVANRSLELTLSRARAGDVRDVALPDDFVIRPMTSMAETLRLTRLQNEVFQGHWGFSNNTPEEITARLEASSTGPEHVLFLESGAGETAGYVWTALEWTGDHTCGKILMTGIAPDFRSQGLGTALVNAGIKHLFAAGAADVHLEVMEGNRAAVRIYRRMGFVPHGKTEWFEKQL